MNKKFSTLVAGLLLAGSLPVAAQYCPANGEVAYRTRLVKAATLDETFKDVKKIEAGYQYQLQVNPASLGIKAAEAKSDYVLTVERDYSTGKLYLTAQPITEATLTHSLWVISTPDREVNGRIFSYKNLETGYELTFDHFNALQVKDNKIKLTGNNAGWNYEENGLMDGCNEWWSWYTTEEHAANNPLGYKKVYSYFHNADSVMYLQAVKAGELEAANVYSAIENGFGRDLSAALAEKKLDGKKRFAIVAVKNSRANAATDLTKASNALYIKPVVAGAKVLNAAEINSMIDADKSWLNFAAKNILGYNGMIWDYDAWDQALNADLNGKTTKFTVCKPGTEEAMTFATNPFDSEYKAIESKDPALARDARKTYSGYNILFETVEPLLEAGDQKQFGYLYVSEYPYEGQAFQGIYNGLEVKNAPYAYLKKGVSTKVLSYAEIEDSKEAKNVVTVNDADALQARYHWKVTYYATNDSVVFEPLNASRMSQPEATDKVAFEDTKLASAPASQFLNTVNRGVAYPGSGANTMFNKAPEVPVALYAMNFGPNQGDIANFLTVGYASGKAFDGTAVDATSASFAAIAKTENGNPAYVTNGKKVENETVHPYQSQMELVVRFANNYTYLQRASVESGVYFINLLTQKYSVNQTEDRVNGAYIVADMKEHVVYDVAQDEQNFNHMPATQWVVEQAPCDTIAAEGNVNYNKYPVVNIYNREFENNAFSGQLYKAADGKFFTINHRGYARYANKQTVDKHYWKWLNCADTIAFQPVEVNTLGYFNESEDVLRENVYQFQNIFDMAGFKFLGVDDLTADIDTLRLLADGEGTQFELFRAEGWVPVAEKVEVIKNGQKVWEETGKVNFEYTDSLEYGYTSEKAGATQLYKTMYKIKLKDANLIDNDHKFVAINNQHKYVVALESEINDPTNQLSFAIVTLKENNEVDGEHCYALVNATKYTKVNGVSKEDLQGLTEIEQTDEYGYTYYDYVNADGHVMITTDIDNTAIEGKLVIEGTTLDAKIADLCETTSSVFALVQGNRPLYRTLSEEWINNMKKVVDFRTIDRQGNESLIEDSHSIEAQRWSMNYLGAENLGDQSTKEGFYIDKVAKSSSRMPQYLIVVAADSVPAYRWCNETLPTGEPKHGVNPSCGHDEDYAGYVEGRFLVNFNDSIVDPNIDKVTKANKFKSDGYTRLGFVEAVHRGDTLYILKAPYTLASIKVASEDASENGKLYIRPDYLSADSAGIVYDAIELDGKHNNVAFSFRNTDEGDYAQGEGEFLIESNDMPNDENGKPQSKFSKVGSFAGAWVKIINNVPVLAKYYDKNGNHNTGDSTDSWLDEEDWAPVASEGEVINQSARFVMSSIDKDASATANEDIATSDIQVVGVKGAVIVKGAAGKVVAINNILGQTVATATIASDNETIDVPAGIVVVSVEGEEAAKVVVK